jgi:hypothetical protein
MNIKIKSAGVTCLIGDDYDRVYTALKNKLGSDDEQLFTERIPGHEYLQWELPGEGWTPLSEGDPLMVQEVRQELLKRKQVISQRFGANQEMAQRILSVPDDSYVYYKANVEGRLLIRLTAWGYRYPERIGGGGAEGERKPKGNTQFVCIHILYDNKPLPNKEFFVNGFKRVTDGTGVYNVGDLPIGYKFELRVGDKQQIVEVQPGQGDIQVDTTLFASVEIRAMLDGNPYSEVIATLSYWGHELKLTTDTNGKAFAKVPQDPDNGMCTISIGNDYQQLPLVQPLTVFSFNVVSPPKEEKHPGDDTPGDTTGDVDKEELNPGDSEIKEDKEDGGNQDTSQTNDDNHEVEVVDDKKGEEEKKPSGQDETPADGTTQPPEEEQHSTPVILEVLAALSLLGLVGFTYLYCCGLLFG